jgi:hypothetical protein
MLTFDEVRSVLDYDPATGVFSWRKKRRGNQVPDSGRAGSKDCRGYWRVKIKGANYRGHQLAWLLTHGEWPTSQIDHINGDKCDNSLANLRAATGSQNRMNSKRHRNNRSGIKGVGWVSRERCWLAYIQAGGPLQQLGLFRCLGKAAAARRAAERELFGEYSRDVGAAAERDGAPLRGGSRALITLNATRTRQTGQSETH